MKIAHSLGYMAMVQTLLGIRVIARMIRSAGGERILAERGSAAGDEQATIIVPVLNEIDRLSPCLEGLMAQGPEVPEIIVVDGGSHDGTQELVYKYAQHDPRIRLVDASPIAPGWNGKAWGLQVGLQAIRSSSGWVLTIDADVRPTGALTRALLGQAKRAQLTALSVATRQELGSSGEGLLHPALLTTMVYRCGLPGKTIQRINEVQANGQCFLLRRDALEACNGFQSTRYSICEDITLARMLVKAGYALGFYEAGDLVSVKMYKDWRDTWLNWTRSLPMHDQFSGINTVLGWLEIALVQALPLPLLIFLIIARSHQRGLIAINGMLVAIRIGVLIGTARAYQQRPWSYWFSPLCDIPVAVQLGKNALQRKHVWRGRAIVRGGTL